jgi:hypothetical protein
VRAINVASTPRGTGFERLVTLKYIIYRYTISSDDLSVEITKVTRKRSASLPVPPSQHQSKIRRELFPPSNIFEKHRDSLNTPLGVTLHPQIFLVVITPFIFFKCCQYTTRDEILSEKRIR